MIAGEPWTPRCMDPDEWAGWQAKNRPDLVGGNLAAYPCGDCIRSWREAREREGLCNRPENPPGQMGLDLFRAA